MEISQMMESILWYPVTFLWWWGELIDVLEGPLLVDTVVLGLGLWLHLEMIHVDITGDGERFASVVHEISSLIHELLPPSTSDSSLHPWVWSVSVGSNFHAQVLEGNRLDNLLLIVEEEFVSVCKSGWLVDLVEIVVWMVIEDSVHW